MLKIANRSIFALILIISLINSGCALVGFETVEKTETEYRTNENPISKKLKMGLATNGEDLIFQLKFAPEYQIEQRDVTTKTTEISPFGSVIGTIEAAAFLAAIMRLRESGNRITIYSDFDWENVEPWRRFVVAGVLADGMLSVVRVGGRIVNRGKTIDLDFVDTTKQIETDWKTTNHTDIGDATFLRDQPFRIELPQFGVVKSFQTQTGKERISITRFTNNLPNVNFRGAIDFKISTDFDGKTHEEIFPISDQDIVSRFKQSAIASNKTIANQSPTLVRVSPSEDHLKINSETIEIVAVATDDQGIKKIRLTVNGEVISGRGLRRKREAPKNLTIRETVPIGYGENRIELIAIDIDGRESKPIFFDVTRDREFGELWIVSIGVSDYENVSKLNYADDDAIAIAHYFRSIGVPKDHLILMTDREVTVQNVRRIFGELMAKVKRNSTVIIFFSGHGAPSPNQNSLDGDGIDKYLLTSESDPDNFYATAFPMDEVARIFQNLKSDRIVFITDTCYSGATGGRTILASAMIGKRSGTTIDYDKFLERLSSGKGCVILTASDSNELSQELDDLQYGVFTYFLIDGLKGKADRNNDGFITVNEIYQYVTTEVPKRADQTPVLKGSSTGEIVIGRSR